MTTNHYTTVMPAGRVLIVDDEAVNIQVLAEALPGLSLSFATEAERALALASEHDFDLILLDVVMPGISGLELLAQLKAQPRTRHVPVIFVTSKDELKDEEQGLLLGAVDYITKPIRPAIVRARVATHIKLKLQHDQLQRAYLEIEKVSLTDPLTGLGNRRFLSRSLMQAQQQFDFSERRHASPERRAFVLVDVDHFKAVNDRYGHAAGDDVLARLATILREHCRDGDLAARWGGEEFLLCGRVQDETEALTWATRVRLAVGDTEFSLPEGRSLRRTCSIGVAVEPFLPEQDAHLDWQDMISLADAALYVAKRSGRNQCVLVSAGNIDTGSLKGRISADFDALVESGVLRLSTDTPPAR